MNQHKLDRRGKKKTSPRTHLSLSLPEHEVTALKTVMGWMLTDPAQADARPCYQTAIRYALNHTLAHPPAHVRPREA